MRHVPALDGLRAVAVLSVVAYHAGLPMPAGFIGVDVFFVISGYLITRILAEELPRPDLLGFYARRARRILPAMLLVLVTTLALSLALLPNAHDAIRSGAAAAAFVANVFFQLKTGGYWADSAETMPLLHLWSLSVEEQFYLVWPALLIVARKRPVAALWAVAIGSLALAEVLMWYSPNAAFYQMPARAWELATGGLVALGAIRFRNARIGLVLVLLAALVPTGHFPGVGALPAVIGAAWVIAALHAGERLPVLELRPATYVGLISYSLYLWHWPLLALARATRIGETPLSIRLALVALAFLLAALTYRYVETPFRRSRARAGRTVAIGTALVASLSACAFAAAPAAPEPMEMAQAPVLDCEDHVGFKAPSCLLDRHRVVLLGDSFGPPWSALALSIAAAEGVPATRFIHPGCPVVAGQTIPRKTRAETEGCRAVNDGTMAYISAHGAEAVVVATNLADLFHDYPAQAGPGLATLVHDLHPHVGRLVIVAPTPDLMDARDNCAAAGEELCVVSPEEFERQAGAARRALATLGTLPGVEVVDASGWFLAGSYRNYHDREHVTPEAVRAFLAQHPPGKAKQEPAGK